MNTAEIFAKSLAKHGVEYVFGLPGEENLTFTEALLEAFAQKMGIPRDKLPF